MSTAENFKFVINRKIWLRGEGSAKSSLFRDTDGKQCCLGIYLNACGVPKNILEGCSTVKDFLNQTGKNITLTADQVQWMISDSSSKSSNDVVKLYSENDYSIDNSEENREKTIKELFAKNNIDVEFIG